MWRFLEIICLVATIANTRQVTVEVTSTRAGSELALLATSSRGALQKAGSATSADTVRTTTPAHFLLDVDKAEAKFTVVGDSTWLEIRVEGPGGTPSFQASGRAIVVRQRATQLQVVGVRPN